MEIQKENNAKFAFYYLLSLVSLLFVALSTGMIIFQIINKYVVDIINEYSASYSSDALRFAISALVIATPIFFLMSRQIYKFLFQGDMRKNSAIRKWLTYFIMLVSSVVMIGWLIATLNNFLDGELTIKFFLKAITALGISALIFSFYFYDMRRQLVAGQKDKIISIYAYGSLVFVLIVFISSLFVVEPPSEIRNRKMDDLILRDFSSLQRAIDEYYSENSNLPNNLAVLKEEYNYINDDVLKDPETNRIYDYKIIDNKKYELCAVFRTANTEPELNYNFYKSDWLHESGEQCIEQRIRNKDEFRP